MATCRTIVRVLNGLNLLRPVTVGKASETQADIDGPTLWAVVIDGRCDGYNDGRQCGGAMIGPVRRVDDASHSHDDDEDDDDVEEEGRRTRTTCQASR